MVSIRASDPPLSAHAAAVPVPGRTSSNTHSVPLSRPTRMAYADLPAAAATSGVTNSPDFRNNPYGYTPTEWICILFLVLFSLSTAIHAAQAVYTRLWWLFLTVCTAGTIEIIGWAGRLWSSRNVLAKDPYLMQIVTTIIAPTPLVAANFIILGQLIRRLGPSYSRLSPKWYTLVFVSCDIAALITQAVGGATAATAVNQNNSPDKGGHVMLGGIVFQMASITIYMALAAEFILRFLWKSPVRAADASPVYPFDRNAKLMLAGLTLSSLCIYVRSVYRTIELANGWTGYVIHTQRYFDWLDGGMICLAIFVVNIFHPGLLLGKADAWKTVAVTPENSDKHAV
ncbi:RTA1-domain-containing protein [Daedalea quercina L-15889]|uniref:RTA1-domain-containing protein n=1 Tax=Daedalea quercina L-15889 TaxID=1314783 RepID=A0A165LSZ3_9APHY|nr:RTA1-domain-containing protein [Daedalea quercina L-15889]